MGAWIEISSVWKLKNEPSKSLLIWERGLKLCRPERSSAMFEVAPYMGAWIEIWSLRMYKCVLLCRSLYGSVDWNPCGSVLINLIFGRSLYGSVDWNLLENGKFKIIEGRSLYGSVDWNISPKPKYKKNRCRSLYGSVDWNLYGMFTALKSLRRSLYGSVDWNCYS